MKKLLFAVQVFGLLAMFPIVVTLEMNHVKGESIESRTPPEPISHTEQAIISVPEKASDKMLYEVLNLTLETFF